jgi:tetratricopeptide (TPR) repeat protein
MEERELMKITEQILEYMKIILSKENSETPKTGKHGSDKDLLFASNSNLNNNNHFQNNNHNYTPVTPFNPLHQSSEKFNSMKEIYEIYLRFLQVIQTIGKLYYSLGEFSSYENWMINFVEKIEKVFLSAPHGQYIVSNAYLLMANLYIELDNLGKAIILYNECLNLIPDPKENKEYADLAVAVNYNLGIVYFITDQYYNSKLKLEQALRTKKDIKNEEFTEQTAIIYETLGEIEIEYKHFSSAFNYLQKSIDIRSKLPNIYDKKSKMKINILLDYIYQNLEKENDIKFNRKASITNSVNNQILTKEEKEFDDLMNFIRNGTEDKHDLRERKNKINKKNDVNIEELEKFFLFITKLSSLQIQVLNSTQPKDLEKNLKMPIFFSGDFKNSLNHHQRLEVNNLKIMSLGRNIVLKNPRGKIEVENLNYDALHAKNSQNNLSSIKNYFLVNKILKNWEVTKRYNSGLEPRLTKLRRDSSGRSQMNLSKNDNENSSSNFNKFKNTEKERSSLINLENTQGIFRGDKNFSNKRDSLKNVVNVNSNLNNLMPENNDIKNSPIRSSKMNSDFSPKKNSMNIKNFDFDHFRSTIRNYVKTHLPEKEYLIDDSILLFFSQKLKAHDIELLMESPESIIEIIEEYNQDSAGDQDDEDENYLSRSDSSYDSKNAIETNLGGKVSNMAKNSLNSNLISPPLKNKNEIYTLGSNLIEEGSDKKSKNTESKNFSKIPGVPNIPNVPSFLNKK